MKFSLGALLFLLPFTGHAGMFVQKAMFVQTHLAVGVGGSVDAAMEDAKSAIPTGTKEDFYEPDSNFNGPGFQCLNGVIWTEKDQCWGGSIQYVIPLRHVSR